MRLSMLAVAVAVGPTTGCGASDDTPAAPEPDLEAVTQGSETLLDLGLATSLAGSYFDFGSTFDLALTDVQLAALLGATVERNLGGCGHVTVRELDVIVDFSAAPGCALATGLVVTGRVVATVSKLCCFQGAGFMLVSLPLDGVTVDGRALSGTYTLRAPDTTRIALASAGAGIDGLLDVVGSTETLALSTRAMTTDRTMPVTRLELRSVVWRRGDCYPSTGTAVIERGESSQTLGLTDATATSGIAGLTIGAATSEVELPAYGACPPAGF